MQGDDLSAGQLWLLKQLAQGKKIAYSQDGDSAWFCHSGIFIGPDDLSEADVCDLRDRGFIGPDPSEVSEPYRCMPCEVITDLGRRVTPSKEG